MKIITTVGTSLVTNLLYKDSDIKDLFDILKQQDYSKRKEFQNEYDKLLSLLKQQNFDEKTSAEMKSIINIQKSDNFNFLDIELIATDTLLSPICSEAIKFILENNMENIKVNFNEKNIIKDLQVSNFKRYKKGLINLINRLNDFTYDGQYTKDLLLNITGGFKGVIPYMTLYGQINNIPLFYIFEFTNSLIEIPQLPITLNETIFDKYWQEFYKISQDMVEKDKLSKQFIQDAQNLIEVEDGYVYINALGKILWDNYQKNHFFFYTTDETYQEIKKQKNILSILSSKFKDIVESKTETKGSHKVYDDGNNPNRIFYFKENSDFYIYKTFQNHSIYEKYINQNSINKEDFINRSKLFKI